MTLSITIPNVTFPNPIPLFTLPDEQNCLVFSLIGDSPVAAVANRGIAQEGVIVGAPEFTTLGMKTAGAVDYIQFDGLDPLLSNEGLTEFVAVYAAEGWRTSGLVGVVAPDDGSLSRRLYLRGGYGWGSSPTDETGEEHPVNTGEFYILSLSREVNGVNAVRRHGLDGQILESYALGSPSNVEYNPNTVFEVGRSAVEIAPGGAYIQAAALWRGKLGETNIIEAARIIGSLTGRAG